MMAGQFALGQNQPLGVIVKDGAKKDGLSVKWGCQWLLL